MSKAIDKNYSEAELRKIQQKLDADTQRGFPTQYEVYVDELEVIGRTENPKEFETLSEYIDEKSTYEIEVRFYKDLNKTYSSRIFLYLPRNKPRDNSDEGMTLSGFENKLRENSIETERRVMEKVKNERTLEDYEKLKLDYAELDSLCTKYEEELKDYRSKKFHLGDISIIDILSGVVEGVVRNNPGMLRRLPGGEVLAGAIEADNREKGIGVIQVQETNGASFTRAEENQDSVQLDETDKAYLLLIRKMQHSFTKEEFLNVMELLDHFTNHPSLISKVYQFLHDLKENSEKTTQPIINQDNQTKEEDDEY